MMRDPEDRALDQAARRIADRHGYVARKSQTPLTLDNRGEFMIVDPATGFPIAGFHYDMKADEVIDFFRGEVAQ